MLHTIMPFDHLSVVLFIAFISYSLAQYSGTLQSVQILFRHGQRAPTNFLLFPTEDFKLLKGFTIEPGEMTNDGIVQEYQLGQNIRTTYDVFIGKRYVPSKLSVLTGVDNRTVVSASTVLASLFPPQDDQIWKKYFNWQPIAIHTQPILDHVSFGALERCKALLKFVEKSTAYQKIVAEDSKLKSWLTALTGINVSNPILYNRVLDTLMSRANLNQLPPPIWARNGTVQKLLTNKHRRLHSQIIDIFLSQSGGWIFDQFVDAIENRINQNTNHTLLLYSAHDASIQTIGKFLSVPELDTLPSFGAYMALEHHFKDGQNIIELWYHPVLNGSRRLITIPNCTDPCSFETFKKLKPRVSSSSWMFTCQGQPPFCDDDTIVLGAMIGLTILLGILSVLLIFVCCAYRHRLNKLLDPEQQSLLHS